MKRNKNSYDVGGIGANDKTQTAKKKLKRRNMYYTTFSAMTLRSNMLHKWFFFSLCCGFFSDVRPPVNARLGWWMCGDNLICWRTCKQIELQFRKMLNGTTNSITERSGARVSLYLLDYEHLFSYRLRRRMDANRIKTTAVNNGISVCVCW